MKKFALLIILIFNTSCQQDGPKQLSGDLIARQASLSALAESEKNRGNHSEAAELQANIMALDAYKPESFITLAKVLRKQGHNQSAVDFLQGAHELHPNNDGIKIALAKALIESDNPSEAITVLEGVKSSKDKDYYNSLGVAHDSLGNHEVAQDILIEGLDYYPDDDLLLNNLALSFILSGDYESGIEILKDLVKQPNAKPKYRQNLALAYGLSAKPAQARKLLVKDLSKKEAEENLKFYNELRAQQ